MGQKLKPLTIAGLALAPFTAGTSLALGIPQAYDALKPHTPSIKPPGPGEDEEAAAARERERRRLSTSGRPTVLSQGRANALSASIGKRLLGGTQ